MDISSLPAVLSSRIFLCRAKFSMQNVDVAERDANSRDFEYSLTTYTNKDNRAKKEKMDKNSRKR